MLRPASATLLLLLRVALTRNYGTVTALPADAFQFLPSSHSGIFRQGMHASLGRSSPQWQHHQHNQGRNLLKLPLPLFSSRRFQVNGDRNNKNPKKPLPNPIALTRKLLSNLMMMQSRFLLKFRTLSRKAKLIVVIQLMALGLIFGAGARRMVDMRSGGRAERAVEVPYSVFMDLVERNGKGATPGQNPAIVVEHLVIGKDRIGFRINQDKEKDISTLQDYQKLVNTKDVAVQEVKPRLAYANKVNASPDLVQFLRNNKIPFRAASTKGSNTAATLARSSIFVIYCLFLYRMYRTMSGGGGSADTPGKLAAARDGPLITFDDIEGIDSAKYEVMELVDTLRNPGKYAILGARAPTGLLLEGPPGTGKTMLARACAATAGVPLLYCSGSDFVEMFVGRGAARVRKTFARAAKLAPCIVFIDELDALGKSRATGGDLLGFSSRSNDEAEQTLNQLLACMDGLDSTKSICVLAATNRKEVLDTALTRPGRFDRIIKIELPNAAGRERILRVHAKKLPGFTEGRGLDEKRAGSLGRGTAVDLSAVAAVTSGLSGAELEFIVNEAAIRAVRRVSAKLREGVEELSSIVPTVNAKDFEESVRNYYATRRPSGSQKMSDLFNSVLKPKGT